MPQIRRYLQCLYPQQHSFNKTRAHHLRCLNLWSIMPISANSRSLYIQDLNIGSGERNPGAVLLLLDSDGELHLLLNGVEVWW
jgi:hypothetical protein